MKLILASSSPRRREILTHLGLDFCVLTRNTDESSDLTEPEQLVRELAGRKAEAVRSALSEEGFDPAECLVLASDTVVGVMNRVLGKPRDRAEAEEMLRMLSGYQHAVLSGFALIGPDAQGQIKKYVSHDTTFVSFEEIPEEDLQHYLDTPEPYDKAGAYAIQDHAALWCRGLVGDYYNVVGLPVHALNEALKTHFGMDLNAFKKA